MDFSQSFIVPPLYPEPHERMAKDTCLPQSGGGSCTRLWVPHKGIGLTPQDSPSICTHSCAVPSLPHPAQITQPGSLLQSSAPHAGHPVLAPGPHSVWQQSLGPLRTVCLNKSTSPQKSAHNQYLKRTTAISRHAAISWRGCCITSRRTSSPTTPPPHQKSRAPLVPISALCKRSTAPCHAALAAALPPALSSATCCWKPLRLHGTSAHSCGILLQSRFFPSSNWATPPGSHTAANELWQTRATHRPRAAGFYCLREAESVPSNCPRRNNLKWPQQNTGKAKDLCYEGYRRGGERKYLLWEITKIQMQSSSAWQCSQDSPSSLISQAGPQQMLSKDKWNTTIVGKGKW